MNYRKYSVAEGKRLAKYLKENPDSAKNAVFLSEALNSFAQFVHLSENGFLKPVKKTTKKKERCKCTENKDFTYTCRKHI